MTSVSTVAITCRAGKGCVYSFDPVGSYERETFRAAGTASSLLQPLLDNQVCTWIHVDPCPAVALLPPPTLFSTPPGACLALRFLRCRCCRRVGVPSCPVVFVLRHQLACLPARLSVCTYLSIVAS